MRAKPRGMLRNLNLPVLMAVAGLTALALILDVRMVRRSMRASALLQESGTPSEKRALWTRVETLRAEHKDLLDLTRKLQSEEGDLRDLAEARREEATRAKALIDRLTDDLQRAAQFRALMDKASCKGNYLELMRVQHAPQARPENSDFKDVGTRFLRSGYWVYAHPFWFVWSRSRRHEAEAEKTRKEREAEAARSDAEWERQRQLEQRYGSALDAEVMAKQFVKQSLTHPSTAKFPFFLGGGASVNAADGNWHVTGRVKAKNAFGLELTYRWSVVLRRVTGDTWNLVDIQMLEEGT